MKSIKTYLFAIVGITVCCGQSFGQDIILKHDSTYIKAKVLEVSESQIKYKRDDNLDGPIFIMKSGKVNRITFDNGTKHQFAHVDKFGRTAFDNRLIHKKRQTAGIVVGSIGMAGMIAGALIYSNQNYGSGALMMIASSSMVISGGIVLGTSVKYLKRAKTLEGKSVISIQPTLLDVQGFNGALIKSEPGYGLGLTMTF